ncbi:MAG: sporulation integral membrane protein YtvI [Oscillospiraceae bacterium]|nr:sporulation integral membrane protein YtvI [Oscillospiraceae bacterium]
MENRSAALLPRAVRLLFAAAALFLTLRFLLPVSLPFLLAFLTAAAEEPAVRFLTKKFAMKRRFASTAVSLAVLALIAALAFLLLDRAVRELTGFLRGLPELLRSLRPLVDAVTSKAGRFIESAPPEVRGYLENAFGNLTQKASELPAALTGRLLTAVSNAASGAPGALVCAVTYVIGVFFISGSYGEIKAFALRQIPPRGRGTALGVRSEVAGTLTTWCKAQVLLVCATFLQLTAAFLLLRVEYAAFLALFVSLVDALPVLGVGTVLLPWAAVCLVSGAPGRALALAVTYGVTAVVRGFLEPKLVGGMLGVHQAAVLAAVYVGFRVSGVVGMIAAPLLLVLLSQLNDKGYLRLWR